MRSTKKLLSGNFSGWHNTDDWRVDLELSLKRKLLKKICKELFDIDILLCKISKEVIEEKDYVYYDKRGVINSDKKDPTNNVNFKNLDKLREQCERYRGHSSSGVDKQSSPRRGSIGPLMTNSEHKELFDKSTTSSLYTGPRTIRVVHPRREPVFMVKSAVIAYARSQNIMVGSDVYDALNKKIEEMLLEAIQRSSDNKRKTLKAYDF